MSKPSGAERLGLIINRDPSAAPGSWHGVDLTNTCVELSVSESSSGPVLKWL